MRNIVNLFSVLLGWCSRDKRARGMVLSIIFAGAVSGISSAMLIAVTNTALSGARTTATIAAFFGLCVVIPLSSYISQITLVRLTEQAASDLRIKMSRQIIAVPYSLLEKLGIPRILAAITEDIRAVTTSIGTLPYLITQLAIIVSGLVYLGWLSWLLLLTVLAYMAVAVAMYRIPLRRGMQQWKWHREEWDRMFKAFRGLTEGIKELKLDRDRRQLFLADELEPPVRAIQHYSVAGSRFAVAAGNGGQVLFYVFIGLVLFLSPHWLVSSRQVTTGYVLVILFLVSPLTFVLNSMPNLARAHFAASKIKDLGLSFSEQPAEKIDDSEIGRRWRQLELRGVTHTYRHSESEDDFCLGPLDLALYPGELVFLIGGNGSGKTTLAKLLMGLYEPDAGEIRLDGVLITQDKRDSYRQNFAVVFSDFYLFESLLNLEQDGVEARAHEYLERLELSLKVKIHNGKLSTIQLSQGQRKRLALVSAFLSDRPLYIFDEWASDQDPAFKRVFYEKILPQLKANGKTVIVISHDDRYYGIADRLIKLERGQIEYDHHPAHGSTPQETTIS